MELEAILRPLILVYFTGDAIRIIEIYYSYMKLYEITKKICKSFFGKSRKRRVKLVVKQFTAQKIKSSIMDFFSKCDQIRSFLRTWPHLLKKSKMENFIFFTTDETAYSDTICWRICWSIYGVVVFWTGTSK